MPASGPGGTSYLTADHLGSARVITGAGTSVKKRFDYLPFGEEIPCSIGGRCSVPGYSYTDSTRQKFTGKERDAESGLDYFGARYCSAAQGRFTTTDPKQVDEKLLENPQDLNLYTYTINNPLRYYDPDGRDWKDVARGIGKGTVNFVTNTASGIAEVIKNPTVLITGTVEALSTAGQAYLTEGGRHELAAAVASLDSQGKTEVATEALLQGIVAAAGAKTSGLTTSLAARIESAVGIDAAPTAVAGARVTKLGPHPDAAGAHSVFKRDAGTGRVTGYTEFDSAGRAVKRFRGEGRPHGGKSSADP